MTTCKQDLIQNLSLPVYEFLALKQFKTRQNKPDMPDKEERLFLQRIELEHVAGETAAK